MWVMRNNESTLPGPISCCSGMVEYLASYYCVSLVPRPIERVESIVVTISEVEPLSRLCSPTLVAAAVDGKVL